MSLGAPGAKRRRATCALVALLCVLDLVVPGRAAAQITLDGSLGPAGALGGPNYAIGAGLGQTRGANLFHSFGQFNLRTINGARETATFSGPPTIQNIIGRVTGGGTSSIDGRVRSTINGANLFLLNPAGVVFGPNAILDVRGSFHTSTADALHFADGAQFSARLTSPSMLTVAPPVAFGFAAPNPAPIRILGSELVVPDGRSLSLVGGHLEVTGAFLGAFGGRIDLVSVGAPGVVRLSPLSSEGFARMGRVDIAGSAIDVSGARGGTIAIRADSVTIDGSAVFADTLGGADAGPLGIDVVAAGDVRITGGSQVTTDVFGAGRAGAIAISGGRVVVDGDALVRSEPQPGTTGAGGALAITADQLTVAGARLSTRTRGAGRGGDIRITAPEVTLDEGFVIGGTRGSGAAGAITVDAQRLTVANGAGIIGDLESGSTGAGAPITVRASEAILLAGRGSDGSTSGIFNNTRGSGDGASVLVATPDLAMRDAATIESSTGGSARAGSVLVDAGRVSLEGGAAILSASLGAGPAGSVTVRASERVVIAGQSPDGLFSEIQTSADRTGDAGPVTIITPELIMTRQGSIQASSRGGGNAGDIRIETARLTLEAGAEILSLTSGDGAAGSITIAASERFTIAGAEDGALSGVFNSSLRGGRSGSIAIDVGELVLVGGGQVNTNSSGQGAAGTITVNASGRVSISGVADPERVGPSVTGNVSSGLSSSAAGDGPAGRIAVRTPLLELADLGGIAAQSRGNGAAGDVVIDVGRLVIATGGVIDTTVVGTGRGGTITVNASELVSVVGRHPVATSPSVISSTTLGNGQGGQVLIRAPLVAVDAGAEILTQAAGAGRAGEIRIDAGRLSMTADSLIEAGAVGRGAGGSVTVVARDAVSVDGSRISTDASGEGAGGNVFVSAPQIALTAAQIAATSSGPGDAGTVTLVAPVQLVARDSAVTTSAAFADGGNVLLQVGTLLHLVDSQVVAEVRSGQGTGGNITIDPQFLILDGSRISANAFGGPGGNVRITAGIYLKSPDSTVSASSALGQPGTVGVSSQVTDLTTQVARLPVAVLQAAALLRQSCAARILADAPSSLEVTGREASPREPGHPLVSPLAGPGPGADRAAVDGAAQPSVRLPVFVLRCAR